MHVDCKASADEIKSYLVDRLTLVQSNLDSALTSTNSFEVVLSNLGGYYVLHIGYTFK